MGICQRRRLQYAVFPSSNKAGSVFFGNSQKRFCDIDPPACRRCLYDINLAVLVDAVPVSAGRAVLVD
jgi:hypothetical protein